MWKPETNLESTIVLRRGANVVWIEKKKRKRERKKAISKDSSDRSEMDKEIKVFRIC